jgi:uroporphyrinogen-III synthase
MIPRHLHVITTRRATSAEKSAAEEHGIILNEMPLTRISLISPPAVQLRPLLRQRLPWVFTSRNGVAGCRHALGEMSGRIKSEGLSIVYAVGPGTAEEVKFWDVPVVVPDAPDAYDAIGLAKRILLDTQITEAIHWCGVRRRPELGERLGAAGVLVHEIIVYDTLPETDIPAPSIKPDAVLFYSPSAVEALFEGGALPQWTCPLIAIGNTTADALQSAVAGLKTRKSDPLQPAVSGQKNRNTDAGTPFGSAGIFTAARATPDAMMEMAVHLNEVSDD